MMALRALQARVLNAANKKKLLKSYRKLALELHPDRCAHELACVAMQALNDAYETVQRKGAHRGHARQS